ncbi:alpha/beta fold hydrolase [Nocardiopsis sp. CNT312]|uniref:alpha/beta fold hydrolase n=1 Tax=Nocardiopsis sp. CNT312 TaxID=1137268 RepID=UPI00048A5063|nr:alpha/beta hydrolase [Nocardiopsis sp. CNT312]
MTVKHSHVEANGVRLHIAEQGEGPLVLLLHGFPESWYSWRHQFTPLAEAGYRVVAPDQRGYGGSDAPESVDAYTLPHLVGDVTALINALGASDAVVVGHDWGAPVAWTTSLLRPDLVRGVVGLSVPPLPPAGMPAISVTREIYGEDFYQVRFQSPGEIDAQMGADPAAFLRRLLYTASGDNPDDHAMWMIAQGQPLLESLADPEQLPGWLTENDLDVFAGAFQGPGGFTGPLNWYRNIERNQGLLAPFQGRTVDVPALYVIGDRDMVARMRGVDFLRENLHLVAPRVYGNITLPGCGHWTQQERPAEVNAALLNFLAELERDDR